jgi:uncharacterized protein
MDEQGRLARATARLRNAIQPNVVINPPPRNVLLERDVEVPVRDGVALRVNVFRPSGDGRHPVLLSAHPYGKDNLPQARRRGGYRPYFQFRIQPQSQMVRHSAWAGWEAPDPAYWVPRGYVLVNADLRGWGHSDGTGGLLDARQEGADCHDLVEWAARQPWSNGRIGMNGVSYLAISQWAAAATRPPHLAAICPWEGFTDCYRDFARPGGIREDGFMRVWSTMMRLLARGRPDTTVDLRRQQVARPERDAWWADRDADIERIDVPALVCGSFSDHNLHSRGSFEGFRRISSAQKWLYTHRGPKWATYYGPDALAAQARFFDHFLAGADNGQAEQPPVRLEVREDADTITSVRHERQWPPASTAPQRWHLDIAGGALTDSAPVGPATAAFVTRRGSLRFTRRFPTDTEVVGPMLLRLAIEAQECDDVCLFAGVRKLRDGRPVTFESSFGFRGALVTFGMRKASHRRTEPAPTPPWLPFHPDDRAEPLRPDEVVGVDIALHPSATLFRAGEILQLDIRGRWFYPRNPLTGQFPAFYEQSPRGRCVLHSTPDEVNHLDIPIHPLH